MTALMRYARPIDGTIPVIALLYEDEHLLASQEGVGLYDGPNKSPPHQFGTIHVTSHRLFFICGASSSSPNNAPSSRAENRASLVIDLTDISHSESYAGFLMSSSKVTIYLREQNNTVLLEEEQDIASPVPEVAQTHTSKDSLNAYNNEATVSIQSDNAFDLWECAICGYRNPPGLSPAARNTCGLCGMPRSVSSSSTPSSSTPQPLAGGPAAQFPAYIPISAARRAIGPNASHIHSRSLPSTSVSTPAPLASSLRSHDLPSGLQTRLTSAIACSTCTFLNHPSLRECEMCGTPLMHSDRSNGNEILANGSLTSKSAPTSRPASPASQAINASEATDSSERVQYIRLSFRKGGDKAFYASLKTALQKKEWQEHTIKRNTDALTSFSGINSILQNIETNVQTTELGMSDAFSDLRTLMTKAQEMVRLAEDLNERLTAASRNSSDTVEPLEPEEASFVRSSLGQLGVSLKNAAITADMTDDERKYLDNLAKELAGVLQGRENPRQRGGGTGIMKDKGIIGLDEVWGRWNRARGVALISPEATLKALEYLPSHTMPPITTRKLSSGLRVLHTSAYTVPAFATRLIGMLVDTGPCTTTHIAGVEMLSVGLIEELISEVEDGGDILRDDPRAAEDKTGSVGVDIRWWANGFIGYRWDGQEV